MDIFEKMSDKIVEFISSNVKSTDTEIEIMKYGVHNFLLNIYKIPIIFLIAYFLGILPQTLLFMLAYGLVRLFSFGVHAKTSLGCLLSTLIIFIGIAYTADYLTLNRFEINYMFFISLISLLLFAPADTEKRPIINKTRRTLLRLKSISALLFIYILTYFTKNNSTITILSLSGLVISMTINPIIYKILGQKYNNYLNYKKS